MLKPVQLYPYVPNVEYATQNPAGADFELRIYPGANGGFKFYEDEGDNYNYEKGSCSTFEALNGMTNYISLLLPTAKGPFRVW